MPINHLNISYPDFVLNTTIDPEQFDTNNAEIVNKINEILDILHSVNGGREIVVDVIESITASTDLQSALVALKTYIDNADNTIKTDLTNKYNEVNGLISTNTSSISSLQLNKADKSNVYTKTESDTKYATKTENSLKADKATTYLRTELYNRTETDSKLSTNKTDIENKLNAHKTSSDHDTRYYTKDELATNILKITNPGININVKDYSTIATEGQTLFTLPSGVYSRVTDLLEVFYEGSKLAVDKNYKILNDTQFQLLDWSAKSGAEVVAQIQAKVWNTQDLVSGRQLQDSTVDMIKLNQETQNKINSIGDTTQITETNLVEAIQNDRLTLESHASDLAQMATDKVNVLSAYQSGDNMIDPNTTEEPIILSSHANCPISGTFFYIRTYFYSVRNGNKGQIATKYNGTYDDMYIRLCYGGVWTAWERIAKETDLAKFKSGINLIPNSSGQFGMLDWEHDNQWDALDDRAWGDGTVYSYFYNSTTTTTNYTDLKSKAIPVYQYVPLTLSFKYFSHNVTTGNYRYYVVNADTGISIGISGILNLSPSDQWIKLERSFTIPVDISNIKVLFRKDANTDGTIRIANVKLEYGNIATEYSQESDVRELFQYVSDGKTNVSNAITGKGGTVTNTSGTSYPSFSDLVNGINGINTGLKTAIGTTSSYSDYYFTTKSGTTQGNNYVNIDTGILGFTPKYIIIYISSETQWTTWTKENYYETSSWYGNCSHNGEIYRCPYVVGIMKFPVYTAGRVYSYIAIGQ